MSPESMARRQFAEWQTVIEERCAVTMSWADGVGDGRLRADLHSAFAGWIWDEVQTVLPADNTVTDLQYVGPTGCGGDECRSTTCSLNWDVTTSDGKVHRVVVPI